MRFEGPLYDGDSLLRPGPVVEIGAAAEAVSEGDLLHRSIAVDGADLDALKIQEIEARARRLRAETVAGWLAGLFANVSAWLESGRRRREEAYLAQAENHADLEARLREIERHGYAPRV